MARQKSSSKTKVKFNLIDLFCFAISLITSIIVVFFYHENPPFYTFMSIVALNGGVANTILKIKGRRSNFVFGVLEGIACGYTALVNHFYGNAVINFAFYIPSSLIGLHSWGNHLGKNNNVIARKFTLAQAIIVATTFVAATILLNVILRALNGSATILDSASTVFIVFAMILVVLRYREQWFFWLASDILQLIMWTTTNDPAVLMLRIFFPLSDIYGYINWRKLIKTSKKAN